MATKSKANAQTIKQKLSCEVLFKYSCGYLCADDYDVFIEI